jgi:hypothetical protein
VEEDSFSNHNNKIDQEAIIIQNCNYNKKEHKKRPVTEMRNAKGVQDNLL